MRIRRLLALAFAALFVSAGLQVVSPSAASATPTGCSVGTELINGKYQRTSRCTGGTGEHRVWVHVRHPNPQLPEDRYLAGEWAPVGSVSSATAFWNVVTVWNETRG